MTKDELYEKIKSIMVNEFEVDESKVVPEAKLVDDMDLDSIDFIDLVVKTKEFIPEKIDPEIFRTVRTMQDVVDTLLPYTQASK